MKLRKGDIVKMLWEGLAEQPLIIVSARRYHVYVKKPFSSFILRYQRHSGPKFEVLAHAVKPQRD